MAVLEHGSIHKKQKNLASISALLHAEQHCTPVSSHMLYTKEGGRKKGGAEPRGIMANTARARRLQKRARRVASLILFRNNRRVLGASGL